MDANVPTPEALMIGKLVLLVLVSLLAILLKYSAALAAPTPEVRPKAEELAAPQQPVAP